MAAAAPRLSKLDQLYRTVFLTKFFTKGWGEPEKLQRCVEFRSNFMSRESCASLVSRDYPISIDKVMRRFLRIFKFQEISNSSGKITRFAFQEEIVGKTRVIDGHFRSPLALHLPDIVKPPIDKACFQLVLPLSWPHSSSKFKPIVIQLAGTGDHVSEVSRISGSWSLFEFGFQFFGRRRMLMATPLVKESGVGSILLENPFYGYRRPKEQWRVPVFGSLTLLRTNFRFRRSSLCNVMDLFVMGGCLILECLVLLEWCERHGYGPLALHGVSMGGHVSRLRF